MIATSRFVFLHLHKSGGTFVNQWLLRFFADARQIGYHLPRQEIPSALSGLPVVGLVRNPWSYYVSWYSFQSHMPTPNALFRILSEERRLGFEGTIVNMLDLGSGGPHLDAVIAALPSSYAGRGLNLPGPRLEAIRGSGLGFYSFLYRYMYSGDGPLHVVPMERMRSELAGTLRALGVTMGSEAEGHLQSAPASNVSRHGHYADFYTPALRRLVEERDGQLIASHCYRFGD